VVLPWRILRDRHDLARAADAIEAQPRALGFGSTHAGDAVMAGLDALEAAPCIGEQAVIDVSGDGASNGGRTVAEARDRASTMGVQINGLAIVTELEPGLGAWYRANVMTPDGFVIEAEGFADMARAMRRKIIQEIAGPAPGRSRQTKKEG
jgi:Ca-activated chloride channel family protein